MDIFMLRHGCAEPAANRDRDRRLTAEGREELHRVLSSCRDQLTGISRVLASPYVRAQQSCDIAMTYLPTLSAEHRQMVDFLVPGSNPQRALDWLSRQPQDLQVLFVTHQPLVGTLLDELCGFESGRYRMGTAALAALRLQDVGRGMAEFLWLKHP